MVPKGVGQLQTWADEQTQHKHKKTNKQTNIEETNQLNVHSNPGKHDVLTGRYKSAVSQHQISKVLSKD